MRRRSGPAPGSSGVPGRGGPARSETARFLAYLRPYRGTLVLAALVGVLKYNLPVLFPWLLKDVIDHLLAGQRGELGLGLDGLMGLAAVVFCLYAGACYLRTSISDRLAHRETCKAGEPTRKSVLKAKVAV